MIADLKRFADRINAAKERIGTKPPVALVSNNGSPVPAAAAVAPVVGPVASQPRTPVPPPADNPLSDRGNATKYRVTSVIPAGARVAGDLVLEESTLIGGIIDGRLSITGQGMAAFIKPGGVARGGVKANIVLVYGEVYGLIEAEYVKICAGGRVEGVIHAESMLVEKGSVLINDSMRIAPPIGATTKAPIDVGSVVRPASGADVRALQDAVSGVVR
jgi:cytoskeletal protein CcmA (bactofilin family)